MLVRVAIIALAACGSSSSGPTVTITAMAGEQPAGGATVVSHTVADKAIDSTTADAVGVAQIGVADGALVTVLFPGIISELTPNIEVVTAPLADGMTIVGPSEDSAPGNVVGGLQISPKNIQADSFVIQLGCATFTVVSMPAVIDVGARCMGSDQNVDVLVTAMKGTNAVGYVAGRVPMTDGMAMFAPSSWETTYTMVPVTISRTDAVATWSLVSDGLAFTTPLGQVPTGLTIDRVIVTADIGGLIDTTRWFPTVPASISFEDSDFLAPLPASLTAGYSWTAAGLGDAVDLRASWDTSPGGSAYEVPAGAHHVQWDAILPPDATTVAPPPIDLVPPANADIALRYVDGSVTDGFPANEIHADTIVPPVTDGEIRVTEATGLR